MKKKLFFSLLLALALLLSICLSAHAEARLDYVTDDAGVLSDFERQSLNDRAWQISEQTGCGVYVVIVDNYKDYVRGSIETFAEEVFDSYDLGYGDTRDGVLLAMSMSERDYDVYAHGDFGNYAFTDYGKDQLDDTFLDNFRRNDWAGGFQDFVDNSGNLIRRARNGDPLDQWIPDPDESEPGFAMKAVLGFAVSAIVAGGTVGGFKKQMKTAVKQTRAENYVAQGGVKLRGQRDDFVNRTVTRHAVPKAQPSGRSGGHYGGTTISGSHGGSHHSGKF
jgi:Beta-propeller domains of methanol dehydrogenase type